MVYKYYFPLKGTSALWTNFAISGEGNIRKILVHLVVTEIKEHVKGYWGHLSSTLEQLEEAPAGQRWESLSIKNNNEE